MKKAKNKSLELKNLVSSISFMNYELNTQLYAQYWGWNDEQDIAHATLEITI